MRTIDAELRAALAPFLRTASTLTLAQRQAWLDELRRDAPTVATQVERLLAPAGEEAPPARGYGFLARLSWGANTAYSAS